MKAADIKVGEYYAYGRSKYYDPVKAEVLAVGRFGLYGRVDKDGTLPRETPRGSLRVIVRYERFNQSRDANVPTSQIIGPWEIEGPRIEAEDKARAEREQRARDERESYRNRWANVLKRMEALGMDVKVYGTYGRESSSASITIDTIEELVDRAEGI
jgi:hypothetical protein